MQAEPALVRFSVVSLESLRQFLNAVDAYGARHSLTADDLFAVKLALDELGTNLLIHGALPGVVPELSLRLDHNDRFLRFVVRDNGRPFDPTAVPVPRPVLAGSGALPVGGLGLALLRGFVSRLAYTHRDGWNELTLEYERRDSSAAGTQPASG